MFGKKKTTKKVLIVEDDALLSKVLSESFIAEKFNILVIENGLEVYEAARKMSPDIILLDLILPGIDGFEVLKQIKEDDKLKDIPVVVLSNLGEPSDVTSAKALGADEFFIKANTSMDKIVKFVKAKLKV